MKLHVLGSSSAGNGYILEGEASALIIEAGIPLRIANKAINFNISKVEGVIISHKHADHCGRANEYAASGIEIFSNIETLELLNQRYSHRFNWVKPGAKYTIKEFTIVPFLVVHDVTCYGYLIQHKECGLTCFITDSMYSPAVFPNLNNVLLEANYMEDILNDNTASEIVSPSLADRIRQSHMSFETAQEFLEANDLSKVNNIVLLHLSNRNSNAALMLDKIRQTTGKTAYIAEPKSTINFNKTPF